MNVYIFKRVRAKSMDIEKVKIRHPSSFFSFQFSIKKSCDILPEASYEAEERYHVLPPTPRYVPNSGQVSSGSTHPPRHPEGISEILLGHYVRVFLLMFQDDKIHFCAQPKMNALDSHFCKIGKVSGMLNALGMELALCLANWWPNFPKTFMAKKKHKYMGIFCILRKYLPGQVQYYVWPANCGAGHHASDSNHGSAPPLLLPAQNHGGCDPRVAMSYSILFDARSTRHPIRMGVRHPAPPPERVQPPQVEYMVLTYVVPKDKWVQST